MKLLKELKKVVSVPLVFHWSVLILLALFIYSYSLFLGSIYFLIIVSSIIIHEYAHVWSAQRMGARVEKVLVMALGAAAMVEPTAFIGKFGRELKCAIAGPIASLLLSVIFFFPAFYMGPQRGFLSAILVYTCLINLLMFIFNLLPIYPMDGGRVLNAILSMIFRRKRGTKEGGIMGVKVASLVAMILSIVGIILCFYYNWLFMGIMFVLLLVFGNMNKRAVIDMYNKI